MTNNSTESNKNADSGFNKDITPDTSYTDAAKPKLTRESYDENWNMKPTDTPRTDAARFEALRGAALRQDCAGSYR